MSWKLGIIGVHEKRPGVAQTTRDMAPKGLVSMQLDFRDAPGLRVCTKCRIAKFEVEMRQAPHPWCKECHKAATRAYHRRKRKDPKWRDEERARSFEKARRQRETGTWRTATRRYCLKQYGLTLEDYEAMMIAQGGVCAICSKECDRALAVDHCHRTNRVRALLCRNCNTGLGFFDDDADRMFAAIAYLRKHSAEVA